MYSHQLSAGDHGTWYYPRLAVAAGVITGYSNQWQSDVSYACALVPCCERETLGLLIKYWKLLIGLIDVLTVGVFSSVHSCQNGECFVGFGLTSCKYFRTSRTTKSKSNNFLSVFFNCHKSSPYTHCIFYLKKWILLFISGNQHMPTSQQKRIRIFYTLWKYFLHTCILFCGVTFVCWLLCFVSRIPAIVSSSSSHMLVKHAPYCVRWEIGTPVTWQNYTFGLAGDRARGGAGGGAVQREQNISLVFLFIEFISLSSTNLTSLITG